ncbi:MAG TPA: hypothetical protein VMP00_05355 [Burkholderiales bacterium]|nr:hypothetical protein [Burkholderiales bacterium]
MLRGYLGVAASRRARVVADRGTLEDFLASRSSHVAQTSLYGYLRARAGTRFPELFADEEFSRSINIAKWQVWLACLSDLSIYAGGLVAQRDRNAVGEVGQLMCTSVEAILSATGVPPDTGPEFTVEADRLRRRLRACHWPVVQDDETPFSESPAALVRFAPVVDEFKRQDEEIVKNSVRFRWQEVRRDFRGQLDAAALMASARVVGQRDGSSDDRA